jgi:hypothetical protein
VPESTVNDQPPAPSDQSTATRNLVSMSDAARRLGLDKGLVSRQVREFGIPVVDGPKRGGGSTKLIDLDAYVAARAQHLDPYKRRGKAADRDRANDNAAAGDAGDSVAGAGADGEPAGEDQDAPSSNGSGDDAQPRSPDVAPRRGAGQVPAPANEATRHKKLQADKLELELRRQSGELLERAEVEEHLMTAFRTLRDGLLSLSNKLAANLAQTSDTVEVRRELDTAHRELLAQLANDLEAMIPATERPGLENAA